MQLPAAAELATDDATLLAIDELVEDLELLLEDFELLAIELLAIEVDEEVLTLLADVPTTELLDDFTLLEEAAPTIP